MKSFMVLAVFLALAGKVLAECNNMCSGNGVCTVNDMCVCYRNWRGADCSERTCQFGRAFIDTAQGDLNHDGAVTFASANNEYQFRSSADDTQLTGPNAVDHPAGAATKSVNRGTSGGAYVSVTWMDDVMGPYNHLFQTVRTQWSASTFEAFPHSNPVNYVNHVYMECSNKGTCDRTSGECECFPGYEGSACQRTACPNSCSGHGVCRSVKDIVGSFSSNTNYTYSLWDAEKIQGCVCDPGYSGYDCSDRLCPKGDDPLNTGVSQVDHATTIKFTAMSGTVTFFIRFVDEFGDEWTTSTLTSTTYNTDTTDNGLADALLALPNNAIPSVSVTVPSGVANGGTDKWYTVTFTGNPGDMASSLTVVTAGTVTAARTEVTGTKTNTECSGRGLCDYETGICNCFRGYRLQDCSGQSSLAY
jgi:hypothetical protein